ncbi:MAG: prepilin-type N-terminal cleavage/methylation domain-containing protein [Acidobacteriota bacterium]
MRTDKGFTLLEAIIAILIMTTALIALSAALVVGVNLPSYARRREVAKQLGTLIMENIIANKEASRNGFTFDNLAYTTTTLGLFEPPVGMPDTQVGARPMYQPGTDGIYGTADDDDMPNFLEFQIHPGNDGQYNTGNEDILRLSEYSYKIYITNIDNTTKQVDVVVYFTTPFRSANSITLVCQLTDFKTL